MEIYDEAGDIRLLTREQQKALLKAWEEAIPKIEHKNSFKDLLIFGTTIVENNKRVEPLTKRWWEIFTEYKEKNEEEH